MVLNLLSTDLSKCEFKTQRVDDETERKWIGGRGLGINILLDCLKPGIDPLGPENILCVLVGAASGTAFPTSGRFHVVTKSPATGGLGDSNCGGTFGHSIRKAGFEGVVVSGASEKPVVLKIDDGSPELVDGSKYWGKNFFQTTDMLKKDFGDDFDVTGIGLAGENMTNQAAIMNRYHRAAGRCATGAVMGSKKLKAIIARGKRTIPEGKTPEKFRELVKEKLKIIKENAVTGEGLPNLGTAILVNIINEAGIYPTRNFQKGYFPDADKQSGETIKDTILVKKKACWGCPIGCGRVVRIDSGPWRIEPDGEGEGPEYETDWSMGANCGVADVKPIAKAHNLCDDYGMDPISYGSTLACAMELAQRGKIPKEQDGISLEWGNENAIVEFVSKTAKKEGFGADLAMGAKKLAEKYGAPELAIHVKGLELPAYDPRGIQGHALGYATSNRGGCHLRAYMIAPEILGIPEQLDRFSTEGKATWLKIFQDFFAVCDSLSVCKFVTFALTADDFVDLMRPLYGWEALTVEEFFKIGERIYNAERVFINREGFTAKDDTLPKRFLEVPMPEGASKGHVVKLKEMLPEYYELRGWDKEGRPTKEKLKELGIEA